MIFECGEKMSGVYAKIEADYANEAAEKFVGRYEAEMELLRSSQSVYVSVTDPAGDTKDFVIEAEVKYNAYEVDRQDNNESEEA